MALVGQAALLGIGMLWLGGFVCEPARKALLWVRQAFQGIEVWSAFLVALLATSGSLFFSEYSGFIPCHLCWLQRYCMYPLVLILPAAALWPKQWLVKAALIVPVAGLGISVWHRYVEANPAAGSQGCRKGASQARETCCQDCRKGREACCQDCCQRGCQAREDCCQGCCQRGC